MATGFVPFSPFTMFNQNGPLGFWPNNFAANAGDVPNILWVSSLQTPFLNAFSPVFSPLVTDVFGGGPSPLGSAMRPAPLGANPATTGTTLTGTTNATPIVGTNIGGGANTANDLQAALQAAMASQANFAANPGGAQSAFGNFGSLSPTVGASAGNPLANLGGLGSIASAGGANFGGVGTPGLSGVGGQAFNGNSAFGQMAGLNFLA